MKKIVKKPKNPHPKLNYLPIDIFLNPDEQFSIDFDDPFVIRCECGGDKCKTTHSDWCPKYEKD